MKGKSLVVCWVSFNVFPLIEGLDSTTLSKDKGVLLRIVLVCNEGGLCILTSYLTSVSLRINLR